MDRAGGPGAGAGVGERLRHVAVAARRPAAVGVVAPAAMALRAGRRGGAAVTMRSPEAVRIPKLGAGPCCL